MAIQIDLKAPEGNAYCIIGTTVSVMRQLQKSPEEIAAYKKDAMNSQSYQEVLDLSTKASMGMIEFTGLDDEDE